MATYGDPAAPANITTYLDALFSLSLAAYEKGIVDNVAQTNAFFHKIINSGAYESENGGTDIRVNLMYAITPMDSYDGYDELSTLPVDGITQATFEWRQLAVPIAYSMKEVKQNKQKLADLVKAKIQQAELGIQEGFAQQLLWGGGDGALNTPKVSPINGSLGIEPLSKLVARDPTASVYIGNIDQSLHAWWRNRVKEFTGSSTYDNFLFQVNNIYNTCALMTGGPPDLMLCDQTTYELLIFAFWQKYRQTSSDMNFPFENFKFKSATVVMDDKVPDVYSNLTNANTYGTIFFLNTKFFKIKYESESNFTMLKDENGKTFAKPINGDSRVGHIAWMGNTCITNRLKQGVMFKIPRALTA